MKNILNKINNKLLAMLALAFCAFATFAEDAQLPDVTIPTTAIQKLANGLKTFAESALSVLLPVLGAVLVYFCVRWAWRVMKSFMNQGK